MNRVSLAEQRSDLATGLTSIRGSLPVQNDKDDDEDYWAEIDVHTLKTKELRAALEARGLNSKGHKKTLQARLQQSVYEEKEEELEYLAMVEASRRAEAALEESGSVYSVGLNRKGQLGLGDRIDRNEFIVIKELRGKGIMQVCAGGDVSLALSENGNVFTWGGVGTGTPLKPNPVFSKQTKGRHDVINSSLAGVGEDGLVTPRLLETLQGEGIIEIACGPNHSGAVSDGGDLYMWGDGTRGQLGTGKFVVEQSPVLVETLQESSKVVSQLAIGQTHTMVLLEENSNVYSWGFSNSGKLGLGVLDRRGVKSPYNRYFPEPTLVPLLAAVKVRLIACSANHSAVVTDEGIFTWGSGDGGRLGHGDHRDRQEPTLVETLKGLIVVDISLGFWHSSAIIQVPPCYNGGWLYTWGSGYHGQLAQGDIACCTTPAVSRVAVDMHLLFVRVVNGPTHAVAMTIDGDLYSWGSNQHGELARKMIFGEDEERKYTPIPGFMPGFNSMVNRIGRGSVVSFACGKNVTVVATSKYLGETEEEMKRRLEEENESESDEDVLSIPAPTPIDKLVKNILVDGNACAECDTCPGFEGNAFNPNECLECKHNRNRHTLPNKYGK